MSSTEFSVGISDARCSSRVLRPPGGASNIFSTFGEIGEAASPGEQPVGGEADRNELKGSGDEIDDNGTNRREELTEVTATSKKVRVPPGGFSSLLWYSETPDSSDSQTFPLIYAPKLHRVPERPPAPILKASSDGFKEKSLHTSKTVQISDEAATSEVIGGEPTKFEDTSSVTEDKKDGDGFTTSDDSNEELIWATILADVNGEKRSLRDRPSLSSELSLLLSLPPAATEKRHHQRHRQKKSPDETETKEDGIEVRESRANEAIFEIIPDVSIDLTPDFNPVTTTDFVPSNPNNVGTVRQQRTRVPPGGFSSGLW